MICNILFFSSLCLLTGPRITAATITSDNNAGSSSSSTQFLEPTVKHFSGILPADACKELIRLGELEGFSDEPDSIDHYEPNNYNTKPSQDIEVYERTRGVTSPAIWKALQPFMETLTNLVKQSIDTELDGYYFPNKQPDRVPQLGWIFFRKYSPDSPRNSLKLHVDSNMHTLNIALNDDFKGGGIFYVKPPANQQQYESEVEDGRPQISNEYMSYEWLNNIKRQNTSDIIFPKMQPGDILIHNWTVWHAVAPIEAGTRYSFVIFYDMDNPTIQSDFFDAEYEHEHDGIIATFLTEIENVKIDLMWVGENENGDEIIDMIEKEMVPYKEYILDTYVGHEFVAVVSGTDVVVSKFVMRDEQEWYTIVKQVDDVRQHGKEDVDGTDEQKDRYRFSDEF